MNIHVAWMAAFALAATISSGSFPAGAENGDDARWAELKEMVFGGKAILDGSGVVELEAPKRAYDAAIVPVTIKALIPQTAERYIKTITLLVDKNPVPVAAVFHMTPQNGIGTISTRIRVNEYTNVRAVVETSDGKLFQAVRHVKAAGGCSAPATKDQEAALARLGRMKLRLDDEVTADVPSQAQILISHPNNSGLQMNQLTRHYIPAHYVERISISYGERPLMSVEADISLSENPSIHFYFVPGARGELTVEAVDTEGNVFTGAWPVTPKAGS